MFEVLNDVGFVSYAGCSLISLPLSGISIVQSTLVVSTNLTTSLLFLIPYYLINLYRTHFTDPIPHPKQQNHHQSSIIIIHHHIPVQVHVPVRSLFHLSCNHEPNLHCSSSSIIQKTPHQAQLYCIELN